MQNYDEIEKRIDEVNIKNKELQSELNAVVDEYNNQKKENKDIELKYQSILKQYNTEYKDKQNQIKELRSHVGLNQTDFGARIGVRQSTVAGWETGQRIPPDSAIVSICREFHVDEHWLRTGDGKMFTATTRDEEIMDFVGRATIGAGDDFKRRFLLALARLPEERWADIEDFARKITAENTKEEQD